MPEPRNSLLLWNLTHQRQRPSINHHPVPATNPRCDLSGVCHNHKISTFRSCRHSLPCFWVWYYSQCLQGISIVSALWFISCYTRMNRWLCFEAIPHSAFHWSSKMTACLWCLFEVPRSLMSYSWPLFLSIDLRTQSATLLVSKNFPRNEVTAFLFSCQGCSLHISQQSQRHLIDLSPLAPAKLGGSRSTDSSSCCYKQVNRATVATFTHCSLTAVPIHQASSLTLEHQITPQNLTDLLSCFTLCCCKAEFVFKKWDNIIYSFSGMFLAKSISQIPVLRGTYLYIFDIKVLAAASWRLRHKSLLGGKETQNREGRNPRGGIIKEK